MALLVEVALTAYPSLVLRDLFEFDQMLIDHGCDFSEGLVLVDGGDMAVSFLFVTSTRGL